MKQASIVKHTAYLLASLVTVLGLAVVPVSAEHGTGSTGSGGSTTSDTGSGGSGSSSSTNGSGRGDTPNSGSGNAAGDNSGSGSSSGSGDNASDLLPGKLRSGAQQLLQTERKDVKEHTAAVRQKACEQREHSIITRTADFGNAAQRHLDVFNGIFTKVQAFQADPRALQT